MDTFGLSGSELADVVAAAQALHEQAGLETLVLTCGRDGLAPSRRKERGNLRRRCSAVNAARAAIRRRPRSWRRRAGRRLAETLRWAAAVSARLGDDRVHGRRAWPTSSSCCRYAQP